MTIEELRQHKRLLERTLADAIHIALTNFRKNTGYSPSRIGVQLVNVTQLHSTSCEYRLNEVKVEIDTGL